MQLLDTFTNAETHQILVIRFCFFQSWVITTDDPPLYLKVTVEMNIPKSSLTEYRGYVIKNPPPH